MNIFRFLTTAILIGRFPTPYDVVEIEHKKMADGTVKTDIDAPKEVNVILTDNP